MNLAQPITTTPPIQPAVVRTATLQFKSGKVKFVVAEKQLPTN